MGLIALPTLILIILFIIVLVVAAAAVLVFAGIINIQHKHETSKKEDALGNQIKQQQDEIKKLKEDSQ